MKRLAIAAVGLAVAGTALLAASCGEAEEAEKAPTTAPPIATIEQPATPVEEPTETPEPTPELRGIWAYCQEIGTSPDWLPSEEEDALELASGYIYRCYQGKPLYCEPGATAGACMQLEYNDAEPPALADWCREHPDYTWAPFAIIGHGPKVYQWSCYESAPVSSLDPLFNPDDYDDMGYYRAAWQVIPEPQGAETPVPPPDPASSFAQPPPVSGGCESSYPDVCIPRAPPDLDCRHIPFRDFRVLPPDPHGFDADGDGIGCESP